MQYLRLSVLKKEFTDFHFPVPSEETGRFRDVFYASQLARTLSVYESEQWLTDLRSEASVLFMEWTDQEEALPDVLYGKPIRIPFQNKTKLKEHALFPEYREFITPFLYPKLDKGLADPSPETRHAGLTYSVLLMERELELVQEKVFADQLREQEALIRELSAASSEEALVDALQPYLRPLFFETLNLFGPALYRARTRWMEVLTGVSAHRFSSRRLMLHITGQLRQLELNPDHRSELRELERAIKEGAVEVERREIPWKRMLVLTAGVLLIGGLIRFIWSVPVTSERLEMENKTSYMSFTEAERKTMDSLLHQVTQQQQQQANGIDQEILPYVGVDLRLKQPWKNETARDLFAAWQRQDSTSTQPQTNESKPEKRVFPGTEKLASKSGSILAAFSNSTDKSVMVLVFRDRSQQPVYSRYIEKDSIITMKLNPGEYLFVLPGTKVPEDLKYDKLPFSQVDSRFFRHLAHGYVVDEFSPLSVKLIWKEVNNMDFYLLDVSGALNRP